MLWFGYITCPRHHGRASREPQTPKFVEEKEDLFELTPEEQIAATTTDCEKADTPVSDTDSPQKMILSKPWNSLNGTIIPKSFPRQILS